MTPGLRELAPSGFVINFITARIPSLAPVVVAMRMMTMIESILWFYKLVICFYCKSLLQSAVKLKRLHIIVLKTRNE